MSFFHNFIIRTNVTFRFVHWDFRCPRPVWLRIRLRLMSTSVSGVGGGVEVGTQRLLNVDCTISCWFERHINKLPMTTFFPTVFILIKLLSNPRKSDQRVFLPFLASESILVRYLLEWSHTHFPVETYNPKPSKSRIHDCQLRYFKTRNVSVYLDHTLKGQTNGDTRTQNRSASIPWGVLYPPRYSNHWYDSRQFVSVCYVLLRGLVLQI